MNDRCTEVRNKIEPTVEWDKARAAAAKLEALLSDEMSYLTSGNRFQNVYSPMAWVRLCRLLSTLTAGMACMRLVFEGRSNSEIEHVTGISNGSVAAYKAWNTMYSRDIEKMLTAKGKTEKQRQRDLEFLASIGVCL